MRAAWMRSATTGSLVMILVLAVAPACHTGASSKVSGKDITPPRIANLHAFARLYGVVRWFHPSDAAAAIDWDRFAVDGARRIIDAAGQHTLRVGLTEVFAPIAPTVHLAGPGEEFPDEPALHPKSVAGLDLIAWQHRGYGDSTVATGYASKRRHRGRTVALPSASFAALSQSVDAVPLRGSRVRLRGQLRTANHAQGQLWLRVDRGSALGFFDNMTRHPVISPNWVQAEIIGAIDADATRIVFGEVHLGAGTVWYDDLELSVENKDGTWKPIEIQNGGFEAPDLLTSWSPGIGRPGRNRTLDGWSMTVDHDRPASGGSSLRIEQATKIVTEELFDEAPAPGETVEVDLGSGLRARVPIALYSKDNQTIGDNPDMARRTQATSSPASSTSYDMLAGVADVIVLWNVLEHFWPYWNVVSTSWSAELDLALVDALDDRSVDDHLATLERLTAAAPDGHIGVSCPGESVPAYSPFAVDLAEGQVVVTASDEPAIERGDVILSVDGVRAAQLLATEAARISGSPQRRTAVALRRFGQAPHGSTFILRLRRGGVERSATISRVDRPVSEPPSHPPIHRFDDGTYYVDLIRASEADIDGVTDRLATAPGVLFDMRGGALPSYQVLSHLLTHRDDIKLWEAIPHVIRPSTASTPASWEDTSGRDMPVLQIPIKQPHIGGRVAFLIGPLAQSSEEDVMAFVEYYRLGEIVGAATAGTDGNVAQFTGPTGCHTYFTGRRVTKIDGSRLHLIGVKPTIPASRTIAGVTAGQDEVLERALAYVRGGSK
jgi:hypothetical protein